MIWGTKKKIMIKEKCYVKNDNSRFSGLLLSDKKHQAGGTKC